MTRILVVEDEQHLADGLKFNLEAECYDVEVAETGEAALARLGEPEPAIDLIVLDVMLPGINGFAVVEALRAQQSYLPVLMLTARGRADDVIKGFGAGADDYLPKPFELTILIARIDALLRRHHWARAHVGRPATATGEQFEFAGREIDFPALELRRDGRVLPLTLMEANLLRFLVQREGQVVSRKDILEQVWGVHEDTDTRAIDNFIVRLRRHIEDDPTEPRHLLTVRSVGYRFIAAPKTGEHGIGA
jgi:two-component system, OmpR family, alkaline phosphatase synthesis response regulator PhoP